MHSLVVLGVGSMWVVCVLVATIYTCLIVGFVWVGTNSPFIPQPITTKTQLFPHKFLFINCLDIEFTHITHRTNKYKNYLYKYIITKHAEAL